MHRLYANATLFLYEGLEHPWVLVPVGGSWNQIHCRFGCRGAAIVLYGRCKLGRKGGSKEEKKA